MVKIVEFSNPESNEPKFDIIDDAIVFMRNDPSFYRKSFFPAISKIADMHRSGQNVDKLKSLSGMVERGINEYCRKFDLSRSADELFRNQDREAIIDRIFSEEMAEIEKGEYK